MKKLLAVLLAVIMVFALSVSAFATDSTSTTLQFNEDGKFKICVIADPQDGYPTNQAMLAFINELLDETQPDLVVFLGDNITAECDNLESYNELLNPLVERGIPFTLVFGNHDDECAENQTKEELLAIFQQYKGCLAYDADEALHGCGTHNLPIMSSDGSKVAFNLWMFDSDDYVFDENGTSLGYDCVRKDQLDWYTETSAKLAEENGGLVPSIAFQHIVTEETIAKIFVPFVGINPGFSVDNDFNDHIRLGFPFTDGSTYTMIPNLGTLNGLIYEMGCPSFENDGQWDTMKETGDVLAVVTGHDHKSNFEVDVDGIDALQTSAATLEAYHDMSLVGARIITLDENNPWEYETHTEYAFDYALKDGSSIPGLEGISKSQYVMGKIKNVFLTSLMKVLNAMFWFMKNV